jgi:hypothetical protein
MVHGYVIAHVGETPIARREHGAYDSEHDESDGYRDHQFHEREPAKTVFEGPSRRKLRKLHMYPCS